MATHRIVIVGAGPYGLSAAAHLRGAGYEVRLFGKVMEFWERQMPRGMRLRSEWEGSHIADPAGEFGLGAWERAAGQSLADGIPLDDFVRYGHWFQRQVVPEVDPRAVRTVEAVGDGFRVHLEDGESIGAWRVVVATGLAGFAFRPEPFAALPSEFVSHASETPDLASFGGRRVAVIGAGQSALENAALLTEAGAEVEVLTRQPTVNWLATGQNKREAGWLEHLLYPPVAVGPVGINWVVQLPDLYRALPRPAQDWVARKALRPYASGRLRKRLAGVPITTEVTATRVEASAAGLRLTLSDGSAREVAHVLLGTGYRIDVDRYTLLDPALRRAIRRRDHHPALGTGFESSVRGLHFLGAASTRSYGPLMRFVAGTGYASQELTNRLRCGRVALPESGRAIEEVRGFATSHGD